MKSLLSILLVIAIHTHTWAQAMRTLEFETSEVTTPAISMMPDGKSFVFNLLGHLFQLPVNGENANQLTFGPYYDNEPVVSPDGSKIAFISNRDGSDGNLFILDLATKKITQHTFEFMVGSPVWNPDGTALAYLAYLRREEYPANNIPFFSAGDMASVNIVSLKDNRTQRITDVGTYVPVLFQTDGTLVWAATERIGPPQPVFPGFPPQTVVTHFEKKANDGVARIGSLKGRTGRLAIKNDRTGFYFVGGGQLKQYSMSDTTATSIAPFTGIGIALALAADGKNIYAAADAKLWKVNVSTGSREVITWKAKVKMEVVKPAVNKWTAPALHELEVPTILTPQLSPDGSKLVFMSAGFLWVRDMKGGVAKKLIGDNSYKLDPAFSPDGKKLAFVSDTQGKRELRVFDFVSEKVSSLVAVGGYSWVLQPSWSADGQFILYQQTGALGYPYKFIKVNVATPGDTTLIATSGGNWNGRPHFSTDGKSIYYTSRKGMMANVFRLPVKKDAKPEPITNLKRHAHDALVSSDDKWIAIRRNTEIWVAAMKSEMITDDDFKLFSKIGGRSFTFTNDASILFSEGSGIWKKSLTGGEAVGVPANLSIVRETPAPVLISNIRVLDFKAGKFTGPTSVYIENGRISWIESEQGKKISNQTIHINGEGRYAIPGIMDSHTHAAWSNQQITEDRLIAYGVTSVRDVGSRLDVINALRNRGDATMLPVPRYFASGDIYEGLVPLWGDAFFEVNSKEEARDYVKYSKANGASFIKVYASLPWFVKSEVAAEANKQSLPVVGHGLSLEEITRSINFGITSLEHGGPNNDDIVKMMAYAGTYFDPTPGIFGAGTTLKLSDPATLDEKFKTFTPEDEIKAARPGRTPSEAQLTAWKNTLASLKRIHDSGVHMLDGTDALMTSVFHGPSVHWNLQFFADAGIPLLEVLKIGTIKAAESVGAADELGSIETGKLADMLLLDADPLQDIKNTTKIWRVLKGGVVFDPATMRKK